MGDMKNSYGLVVQMQSKISERQSTELGLQNTGEELNPIFRYVDWEHIDLE